MVVVVVRNTGSEAAAAAGFLFALAHAMGEVWDVCV